LHPEEVSPYSEKALGAASRNITKTSIPGECLPREPLDEQLPEGIQMTNELLLPSVEERSVLWSELVAQAEAYIEEVESLPVAPTLNQADLNALLDTFPFVEPDSRINVFHRFTRELKRHQVHTPHPCYFGLFNPAPSFMGILGDCVAATLNPQRAAWSHSPLAVETERRLKGNWVRPC
jgi:hypothetical protein